MHTAPLGRLRDGLSGAGVSIHIGCSRNGSYVLRVFYVVSNHSPREALPRRAPPCAKSPGTFCPRRFGAVGPQAWSGCHAIFAINSSASSRTRRFVCVEFASSSITACTVPSMSFPASDVPAAAIARI